MNYAWKEIADGLSVAIPTKINIRTLRKVRTLFQKAQAAEDADQVEQSMVLLLETGAHLILGFQGDLNVLDPSLSGEVKDWSKKSLAQRIELLEYVPQDALGEVFADMQSLLGLTTEEKEDLGNSQGD